jgi:hypothetical protein
VDNAPEVADELDGLVIYYGDTVIGRVHYRTDQPNRRRNLEEVDPRIQIPAIVVLVIVFVSWGGFCVIAEVDAKKTRMKLSHRKQV